MAVVKSRLSKNKQERLLEHFVAGSKARDTAEIVGVNKSTEAYYFNKLRLIIADNTEEDERIEVDESYVFDFLS